MKKMLLAVAAACTAGVSFAQSLNIVIGPGARVVMTNSVQATFSNVSGTPVFTNNGTWTDAIGKVNDLCGLTFAGSGATSLYDLDVNHASGTTLFNSLVSVYNTATLATGNLNANNNLYIRSDAGNATMVNNGSLTNNVQGLIAKASVTTGGCPSYASNLSLNISGTRMKYQWQTSATGSGGWSDVSGATNATYAATVTQTIYYRCNLSTDNTAFARSTDGVQLDFTGTYPTITLGANPSVIQGITSADLPYSGTTGSPDHYDINWSSAAIAAGFSNVTFATLTPAKIILVVPGAATPAVYSGTVTVTNGCVSTANPFTVTVIAPLSFTGGSSQAANLCENATATSINALMAISDPGVGLTETWSVVSGPSHGTLVGFPYSTLSNGSTVTPTGLTYQPTGSYRGPDGYIVQVFNGSQTATTTVSVTVNPLPVVNVGGALSAICQGGVTAALGGSFSGGASSAMWSDNGAGGSFTNNAGNDPSITTYAASSSALTTVTLTLTTGGGSCGTLSASKLLPVHPNPTVNAGSALSAICQGGATAALGGSYGGGASAAVWNDNGAGGSFTNNGGSTPSTTIYTASSSSVATVTLTLTTSGGPCGTVSASKDLVVDPNPIVNAGSALTAICQGGTTAALGGSFSGGATAAIWNDNGAGGSFINNTGSDPSITAYTASSSALTTVTLTLTTSGGSCGILSVSKPLNVNPNPTVNAGSALSAICQGGTTATLGGSFGGGATAAVWSDNGAGGSFTNNGGTTPSTASYTASSSALSTVTLTLTTNGGSCGILSASKSLVVDPNPIIDNIGNNGPVCAGNTLNLTSAASNGTGTLTYTWSGPSSYSATGSDRSITSVTAAANGTYTLVVSDVNSCRATDHTAATVRATPHIIAIGNNAPVCEEKTLTLSSSVTGGTGVYTYEWTGPNSFTSADEDPMVTASATTAANGIYVLVVTDANSCVATGPNTTSVTVHPIQPIAGATSVLFGQTIALSDPVAGGTWTTPTPWTTTVTTSGGVVKGISAGTSVITYTTAQGCIASHTVSVISGVNACVGQSIALSNNGIPSGTWSSGAASIATINITTGVLTGVSAGKVAITYRTSPTAAVTTTVTVNPLLPTSMSPAIACQGQAIALTNTTAGGGTWYSGNTSIAVVGPTGSVSGLAGGVVNIYFTPIAGCVTVKTLTITPVSPITGTTNVCVGSTMSLSNSTAGGTWYSSSGALATVTVGGGVVHGIAMGKPTIFYIWPNGCWASSTITVNPLVQTTTTTTGIMCQGATIAYSNTTLGGGVWTTGNTNVATVNSSGSVTGAGSGATSVVFTTPAGCVATRPVTVNGAPTISGSTTVCMGQTTQLSSSATTGTWYSSSSSLASVSVSGLVKGVATGAPRISYIMPTGCNSTVTVTVSTLNATTGGTAAMCQSGSMTLANSTPFGGVWTSSNTSIAAVNGSGVVRGAGAGIVTISFTSTVGSCVATRTVTVNACRQSGPASVAETEEVTSDLLLFPNPNNGVFTLRGTFDASQNAAVMFEVLNIVGQIVYRGQLRTTDGAIDERIDMGNNLADGTYILRVRGENSSTVFHFIVGH